MLGNFDQPWRPAYEGYAAAAWTAAVPIFYTIAPEAAGVMMHVTVGLAATSMAYIRGVQAMELWGIKSGVYNQAPDFVKADRLSQYARSNPDKVWLGTGFDWQPIHTQRMYDLKRLNPRDIAPPLWYAKYVAKLSETNLTEEAVGAAWIRGVEINRQPIFAPFEVFKGHTVVFGTTGAGKTRAMEVIFTGMVHRDDVVIIIDPKGDTELRERARKEAKRAGRPFIDFHLAFPSKSCRFDPMKNFNRETELASRVSALVPSETGQDAFTSFAWNTINSICQGMIEVGEKPSLIKIRNYIELGIDGLLIKVYEAFFSRHKSDWAQLAGAYVRNRQKDVGRNPTDSERLAGYRDFYNNDFVTKSLTSPAIGGLINVYDHDDSHFGKMIANLIPILSMLTSGELGALLSPDYDDPDDERPIWDFEKGIAANAVFYFGLDSLSDATVASAVGSLILSDLVAVAGSRYNFGFENKRKFISLMVDEASQVVNDPFITMLNQGRGAHFVCWVFTQTFPDFEAKLGSAAKARKMMGNFNNLIALRTKDGVTQKYITESFGTSLVKQMSTNIAVGDSDDPIAFGDGRMGKNLSEKLEEKIPTDILDKLPNFQYIASISGGRLIQGKFPILID
jgi:conjugal transfer pilus assembly protein TraD